MLDPTRHLLAVVALLASSQACALGIGEIEVTSFLGEPLRARIPVSLEMDGQSHNECATLAGPARHNPELAYARLEVYRHGTEHMVSLTTDHPINDPMLDITLRLEGCGPTLQKDFVLMLSPRNLPVPPAQVIYPPPPMVAATAPTPPRAAVPEAQPASAPVQPARARTTEQARQTNKPAPIVFVLKLDYNDQVFGQLANKVAERRKAAHRATLRAQQTRTAQADKTAAVAHTAAAPAQAQTTLPVAKPVPGVPAQPARPAGAAQAQKLAVTDRLTLAPVPLEPGQTQAPASPNAALTTAPTLSPPDSQPARDLTRQVKPNPKPESPPASTSNSTASTGWLTWLTKPYVIAIVAALMLAALAAAYWLKYRKRRSCFLVTNTIGLEALLQAKFGGSGRSSAVDGLPSVNDAFPQTLPNREGPTSMLPDQASETPSVQPSKQLGLSPLGIPDQSESIEHVLEMAEVMLAFGRGSQAIETLSRFIQNSPRQSIDPWIRLLELYHQFNLRSEFDALAESLHRHFNVAIVNWAEYNAIKTATGPVNMPTLESLEHVMNQLIQRWGTQNGLDFLDKLIADNRGGQRLGLSMPIMHDILLLRDILRTTCKVAEPSN